MSQDKCYRIKRNTKQACHLSLRDMTPISVKFLLTQAGVCFFFFFFFLLNFKEDQNQASCGSSLSHNKFCLGSQVACGLFPRSKFCSYILVAARVVSLKKTCEDIFTWRDSTLPPSKQYGGPRKVPHRQRRTLFFSQF